MIPVQLSQNSLVSLPSSVRFLSIILKMEEMLHSWFPHIKPNLSQTGDSAPAKKQKVNMLKII